MQPASLRESGSLLITHLFKIMNCLESSDGCALLAVAHIPGEGIPKNPGATTHVDPVLELVQQWWRASR